MRLKKRRSRIWTQSFLVHHYLWANLKAAVEQAKADLPSDFRRVLDIGCGHKPYADLFAGCLHIGLNNSLEDASPDLVGDATNLPVATGSIDLVFCTQVLEHVPEPLRLLKECRRALKPGGWMVLSAPFYWPLHEEPYDFFRYTKYGLASLMRDAGFEECSVRADGGDYARLILSTIHMLPRWLELPFRIPLNALGVLLDRVFSSARLPANYTAIARVPAARDDRR